MSDAGYTEARKQSKAIWGTGDYSHTSRLVEPASRELVRRCGIGPGARVLDVAAGHGSCALAAARSGAMVTATDFSPVMMEVGRQRCEAAGVAVEWQEADAEDLPFADGTFDCVTSVFGAMFAPGQRKVASELARVVKPGGTIGMAAWTPTGFTTAMVEALSKGFPKPENPPPDPMRWGDSEVVRELLGDQVAGIEFHPETIMFSFQDFEEMRRSFEAHGMMVIAKQRLPAEEYEAVFTTMETLADEWNQAEGEGLQIPNHYLITIARSRPS